MSGTWSVAKKEFLDLLSDKKYLLMYGLFMLMVLGAAMEGSKNYRGSASDSMIYIGFEMSTLPYALDPLASQITLIGGLLALIISFDTVNKEKNTGSLKVLLSYPIFRDQVLIGKYLGGFMGVVITAVSSLTAGIGVFIGISGMEINNTIIMRLLVFTGISIIYMSVFFGVGLLFSIKLDDVSESLLSSVTIWIISLFVLSSLGNLAFSLDSQNIQFSAIDIGDIELNNTVIDSSVSITMIDPSGDYEPSFGMKVYQALQFISPSETYKSATRSILETSRFDFSGGTPQTVPTSIGTSLERIVPNMLYLIALNIVTFGASYISFNRKEIS